MSTVEGLVIGGERVQSAEGRTFETVNPASGEVFRTVAEGGPEDADRAVRAAAQAYEGWSTRTPIQRAKVLYRWAELIEQHVDELGLLETRDMGMALGGARWCAANAAAVMRYYAGAVDKFFGATIPVDRDGVVLTFREPIGVTALITPWNFPLNIANWKMAPAIAAGNTVVLKPASLSPLRRSGTPSSGSRRGSRPAFSTSCRGPAAPSATRSWSTRSSARSASPGRPRSARRSRARPPGRSSASRSSSAARARASCSPTQTSRRPGAWRRSRSSRTPARTAAPARGCSSRHLQRTSSSSTTSPRPARSSSATRRTSGRRWARSSAAQRDTVEGYVERGVAEGATIAEGGGRPDGDGLARGFYLRPTVLDGCTNDMTVAREEIFGPVVSVITFVSEEEAIRIANDTPYGLSGSLWTRDGARQLRVARALRTGAIAVNSNSSVFPQAPFGGYKASGIGKELGMEGLVHNTELKSVFVSTER